MVTGFFASFALVIFIIGVIILIVVIAARAQGKNKDDKFVLFKATVFETPVSTSALNIMGGVAGAAVIFSLLYYYLNQA